MTFNDRLKIKKYRYRMFLSSLGPVAQAKVVGRKLLSLWDGRRPQSLEIGLTYRCQLTCIHCGVHGQAKEDQKELSLPELRTAIDEAGRLGIYLVIFSGGEPLMRPELVALVGHASGRGIISAISTNGLGMTGALARDLRKKGLAFANISLDSARPQVHDQRRGAAGCFGRACAAIEACLREKLKVIVSTYATKENIRDGDLRDLIAFARKIGADGVRILPSVPAGRWLRCGSQALSREEKDALRELLDPCFVYLEGVCNEFTECQALRRRFFYLSPYGEVQPCSFVPVYFGNVREERLSRIWDRMRRHGFFQEFDAEDCIMRDDRFQGAYLSSDGQVEPVLPRKI